MKLSKHLIVSGAVTASVLAAALVPAATALASDSETSTKAKTYQVAPADQGQNQQGPGRGDHCPPGQDQQGRGPGHQAGGHRPGTGGQPGAVDGQQGQAPATNGKATATINLTMKQALEKAAAQVPNGHILGARLYDQEAQAAYSIVVKDDAGLRFVFVDAQTGQVTEEEAHEGGLKQGPEGHPHDQAPDQGTPQAPGKGEADQQPADDKQPSFTAPAVTAQAAVDAVLAQASDATVYDVELLPSHGQDQSARYLVGVQVNETFKVYAVDGQTAAVTEDEESQADGPHEGPGGQMNQDGHKGPRGHGRGQEEGPHAGPGQGERGSQGSHGGAQGQGQMKSAPSAQPSTPAGK